MAAIINQRWPRDLKPDGCSFGREWNDALQTSPRTRQETLITQGRALWRCDLRWSMPNTDKLAELRYWLNALEGFQGSVQLWDFNSPYPEGIVLPDGYDASVQKIYWTYTGQRVPWTWSGFPTYWTYNGTMPAANGAASLGATSIAIDGLTASQLVCVQGQYVQIGRRLYLATADASSNGSGQATISLSPALIAAVSDNAEVRLVEAACEMRLVQQSWDFESGFRQGKVNVAASFIETVEDFS